MACLVGRCSDFVHTQLLVCGLKVYVVTLPNNCGRCHLQRGDEEARNRTRSLEERNSILGNKNRSFRVALGASSIQVNGISVPALACEATLLRVGVWLQHL